MSFHNALELRPPLWLLFASLTRTVKDRERERESSSLLVMNLNMLQTLARHSHCFKCKMSTW